MKPLISLPVRFISRDDAEEALTDVIEAKTKYRQVIENGLQNENFAERDSILRELNVRDFSLPHVHSIVFMDDALSLIQRQNSKIFKILMKNAHHNFTYFICLQDPISITPAIKSNLSSCWFFGGFNDQKYFVMMNGVVLPQNTDKRDLHWEYRALTKKDAMIFDYSPGETEIRIIRRQ